VKHSADRYAPYPDEDSVLDYSYDVPGSIPGTLRIDPKAPKPEIILLDYNAQGVQDLKIKRPEDCAQHLDTESVSWVDVKGLGSEDILRRLGKVFNLHPLILEDVVNVPQRAKVEEYEHQVVVIARMVVLKPNGEGFHSEQVSLILGRHYLLTVQEEPEHDCFDAVRSRIRFAKGMIRKHGSDYLAYAMLDSIIDGFFPVLEVYGEMIEALEDEVVEAPTRRTLEKIHQIKRELLNLRRAMWPLRDSVNSLIRESGDLISEEVRIYLRDCYDHTVQVLDMIETYRELSSSLMDVYLSSVSNKMNEIMKFLTVISSIFIPLTFLAGIYGMNFQYMPELGWKWGYALCWTAMITIALSLVFFFKQKGWFEDISTVSDRKK
jgi:magnesium transporter